MITVYGIKQCDTCRKALKWLQSEGIEHVFHDFRIDGLERGLVTSWLNSAFSERLVNRRSTSWRQLSDRQKQAAGNALVDLLMEFPTLIKRPVFVRDDIIAVGFGPDTQEMLVAGDR